MAKYSSESSQDLGSKLQALTASIYDLKHRMKIKALTDSYSEMKRLLEESSNSIYIFQETLEAALTMKFVSLENQILDVKSSMAEIQKVCTATQANITRTMKRSLADHEVIFSEIQNMQKLLSRSEPNEKSTCVESPAKVESDNEEAKTGFKLWEELNEIQKQEVKEGKKSTQSEEESALFRQIGELCNIVPNPHMGIRKENSPKLDSHNPMPLKAVETSENSLKFKEAFQRSEKETLVMGEINGVSTWETVLKGRNLNLNRGKTTTSGRNAQVKSNPEKNESSVFKETRKDHVEKCPSFSGGENTPNLENSQAKSVSNCTIKQKTEKPEADIDSTSKNVNLRKATSTRFSFHRNGGELNRTRRSSHHFSKQEIEALVSAVEIQGIGRWSMVKQQSFVNSPHRKATDLKDKWRLLVLAASNPKRKGKCIMLDPDLLERILRANKKAT